MAKPKTVDAYLAAQPAPARAALTKVRDAIRTALPDADETIAYGMPAYESDDRPVLYFAGWKEHFSLYPATDGVLAACGDALAKYEVQKGTIRIPYEALPLALIGRIAKLRAKEVAARARAKKKPAPPAKKTKKAKKKPVPRRRATAR